MEFKEHKLSNGLTLIGEVNKSAESCAIGFFVRTGARDETSQINGVSHFLEHMLFKGTEKLSALAVNEEFDKNYYDFINHYRIEESKKLLSGAESDMRIIGVLYEVGFNSKSTFNAAFKKETGLTPRQYKSLLKKKFK